MKYSIILVVSTLLWNVCQMESDRDFLNAVSKSNSEFTNAMYAVMSQATDSFGNILFSPLSLQVILALTYTGAGGDTAKQIAKGLRLPHRPDVIKSGFKQLLKLLTSKGNVTLEMANTIFPAIQLDVLKSFSDTAKEYFKSDVESVNYADPYKVVETVNGWASKKTHSKITDILSVDAVDPTTKLLLLNAVYFKGDWAEAFDKGQTSFQPFHITESEVKKITTMRHTAHFGCEVNEELGATLLELPYKDKDTSLIVILPLKRNSLANVEQKLEAVGLEKVIFPRKLERREVDLSFPKFNIKLSTNLNDILRVLGMVDMFLDDANFSRMTSERELFVSSVLHKTMIEVSEEGTEAAAVTSVQVMLRSAPLPPDRVVVDHPFAFALISRRARVVLFMGRFTGKEGVISMEALREARSLDRHESSTGCSRFGRGVFAFILSLLSCTALRHHLDKH